MRGGQLEGWWVECTHRAKGGVLFAKYKQAVRACKGRPILICATEDNGPDLVAMELQQFLELIGVDNAG